jgi:hypothetical protein
MWSQERAEDVVYIGEAPESDEEDFEVNFNSIFPESPPSPSLDTGDEVKLKRSSKVNPKYDTLLHRKLREKNEKLKEELINIACQPYLNGSREIQSLTHQLIRSQKTVQEISSNLRKLSKDIINLEATIDSLQSNCQTLPFSSAHSSSST